MKVAIFGSNGMAGHMITGYLGKHIGGITTVARDNASIHCDVENFQKVAATLQQFEDYDYIINCIGLLVKDSNSRPDRAAIINAWFPHYLERWARNKRTRIIHLSTDCVFDGSKGNYVELDPHTEMNAYGRSKSLGEINNSKDITLRTSIIGPELKADGTGLLHWVTTNPDYQLNGYVDAWWNGITTLQMAKCIWMWMQDPRVTGVYHVVNNSVKTNKYQLVSDVVRQWGLHKNVKATLGPKPVNKVLIDTRLEFNWAIPDYVQQLEELHSWAG